MREIRLGDFCTITSSKRIFEREYVSFGIPFYRSKEIIENENHQEHSETLFISQDRYLEIKNKFGVPQAGDMLITSVGTLGVPYVVKDNEPFYFKDGNLTWLKNFSNDLNSRYVYYWLKSDFGKRSLIQSAIGSSQSAITIEILKKYKLLIPPRKEQNNIVNYLSAYDDLIKNNRKRIKILEQMAENLYKEWFVRFRFSGHENCEFSKKSPTGWVLSNDINCIIPKGFHYGCLDELGEFARGKNITAAEMVEGKIPVVSAGLEHSGYHNKANVFGRSLTVSASGANAGYMKYNLSDIWAADCSYYQNDENIWYIYCALKFLQPVIMNMQRGAAQPHVHPKQLNKLCITIPNGQLIRQFNIIASKIFNEIDKLLCQNQNLIKQRDLLLPRLMSGKLQIK